MDSNCNKDITSPVIGDDRLANCVQQLRDLVANSNQYGHLCLSDEFLIKFLRAKQFNVESSFKRLCNYLQLRNEHPELFKLPSAVIDVIKAGVFEILEHLPSGEALITVKAKNVDPKIDLNHLFAAQIAFTELVLLNPKFQIKGIVWAVDSRGFGWRHAKRLMNPWFIKTGLDIVDRCLPLKANKAYFCYTGAFTPMVWNFAKPFLPKELRDKLFLMGHDLSQLHQDISRDDLPENFGGNLELPANLYSNQVTKNLKELDAQIKSLWADL